MDFPSCGWLRTGSTNTRPVAAPVPDRLTRGLEDGAEKLQDRRNCYEAGHSVQIEVRVDLGEISPDDTTLCGHSFEDFAEFVVEETVDCG